MHRKVVTCYLFFAFLLASPVSSLAAPQEAGVTQGKPTVKFTGTFKVNGEAGKVSFLVRGNEVKKASIKIGSTKVSVSGKLKTGGKLKLQGSKGKYNVTCKGDLSEKSGSLSCKVRKDKKLKSIAVNVSGKEVAEKKVEKKQEEKKEEKAVVDEKEESETEATEAGEEAGEPAEPAERETTGEAETPEDSGDAAGEEAPADEPAEDSPDDDAGEEGGATDEEAGEPDPVDEPGNDEDTDTPEDTAEPEA